MSSVSEIIKDIQSIKSDRATLRKFGYTLGIVFLLIAFWQLWKKHPLLPYSTGASCFFLFFGYVCPAVLKPVQKVWMGFAVLMGYVMTRVILFVLFFFIVTPISLLARCFGHRFLDRKWDRDKESYWILRSQGKIDKSRYENQF
jgi:hypothetical protein